jgi:L-asparaginase
MPKVSVLATGGTIATRRRADGSSVAAASAEELLASLPALPDVEVVVDDVFRIGSYRMTLERMAQLAARARGHLADGAAGVVVTHGTDTIEETALFLELFVDGERPVVLTGAQRAADAPDSDGPRNLAEAIAVAVDPDSAGRGAMVVFDGTVYPARGIRKAHTLASTAFVAPDGGTLGWVHDGRVQLGARRTAGAALDLSAFDAARARVDIVAIYPGADATALHAFAAAGARGVVLEGTGAGNANPEICAAVAELCAAGVVVVTATRVEQGPVAAIYGDGGGIDLLAAGAVPAGRLRPSQARICLAALLGVRNDVTVVREELPALLSG